MSPLRFGLGLSLALLGASAQAEVASRTQLPVSLGAGLNHPLPLAQARGELAFLDAEGNVVALNGQAEAPFRTIPAGPMNITLSAQGSLLIADFEVPDDQLISGRGGVKASLPIAQVPGLWTSVSLNGAYSRFDDDSDTDVFAVLSARYQATSANLGKAMDLYSSIAIGADGPSDTGILIGAALPLSGGLVAGAEVLTEGDRLNGYMSFPLQNRWTLTGALGIADDVDFSAQVQLGRPL